MKQLLLSFLFLLSTALCAQSQTDAERLARLFISKDMETAAAMLANNFGIREPEISKVVIEEMLVTLNSFYASEYEKRISADDLQKILQILDTDAGRALLRANLDVAVKVFQHPEALRSLLISSCVRSTKRLSSEQASRIAPLCK
jgi:hypothetical protein